VRVTAAEIQDARVPGGQITEAGVRNNVSVALQYISAWLGGNGAVAIFNLMEDAATAEISRAQLWQWITNGARLADGRAVDKALYQRLRDEELAKLANIDPRAVKLLDQLALGEFLDFLTLPAYALLE
jgi:malate synthase